MANNPTPVEDDSTRDEPIKLSDSKTLEEFIKSGFTEIVHASKTVNAFPHGNSRDWYCAYPSYSKIMDIQSNRILNMISKVFHWQQVKGNIQRRQLDEQFEMLIDWNDGILERIASNMDKMEGMKKKPPTMLVESRLVSQRGAGSWNKPKDDQTRVVARLLAARNTARPQIKFQFPVDNSIKTAFVPRLKVKPNAQKPLALVAQYNEDDDIVSYAHPYEFELIHFKIPKMQLQKKSPQFPRELSNFNYSYVDTVSKLKDAVAEIRKYKEIAVDVEHHSYRTFQGITCLVQLSTCDKDYLFDALALRDEMHILNDIFTDPSVVKILHGAECDIEWLQRDLAIYIVNMFDTHQASKVLMLPRLSLAYLLNYYCDVVADKTFQLADWRMRPLAPSLIDYARQDTHYLIYIYGRMTNDLLQAANDNVNKLQLVYERSTDVCKRRYMKPFTGPESYLDVFLKSKRSFDNRQLFALRDIFKWRDETARNEDESFGYVLPNHMMLQIAESLPREMQGILACCNPIPTLVRQHLTTLHQIILRAREQPLVKPILQSDEIHRLGLGNNADYNSPLYCPHDLSCNGEFRDDLPTLITFKSDGKIEINKETYFEDVVETTMPSPYISIFEEQETNTTNVIKEQDIVKFISPYQRYMNILPQIEKNMKEAARIEAIIRSRQLCPDQSTQTEITIRNNKLCNGKVVKTEVEEYEMPVKTILKRKRNRDASVNLNNSHVCEPKKSKMGGDDALSVCHNIEINSERRNAPSNSKDATNSGISVACKVNAGATAKRQQPPYRNARTKKCKTLQSSDKPIAQKQPPSQPHFDYKNVDFNRYQGGGQRAVGSAIKAAPHRGGNSRKANNKKFNKMFTFTNVKNTK